MTEKDMSATVQPLGHSYLSSDKQVSLEERRRHYFETGAGNASEKMASLGRFTSRQNTAKLLAQHEMMAMTRGVAGDIIEAGVYFGGGLMNWALIGAALEPFNYQCKIWGFDTFEGTQGVSDVDLAHSRIARRDGEYFAPVYDDLQTAIELFDADRPLSHLPKIQLVKGDLRETAAKWVSENPASCVRILHIGVNIHAPTKACLEAFLPIMTEGGLIGIDGLNYASGGCMQAVREVLGKDRMPAIRTMEYYPNFTYFQVGQ